MAPPALAQHPAFAHRGRWKQARKRKKRLKPWCAHFFLLSEGSRGRTTTKGNKRVQRGLMSRKQHRGRTRECSAFGGGRMAKNQGDTGLDGLPGMLRGPHTDSDSNGRDWGEVRFSPFQ